MGGSGGASGPGGSGGLGGGGGTPGGSGGSGGSATCDAPDEPPGSAETNECEAFTPCGGELTGAWNITRACADPPYRSYSVLCGEGTDTTELVGTLGFAVDGTYEARGAFHTTGTVSAACLESWDRTCGENPFEGCTPSAGGCDCDHVGELSEPEPGWTFETEGNVLRLTDGCEVRAMDYCVEGTTLRLRYASDTRVEVIGAERDTP